MMDRIHRFTIFKHYKGQDYMLIGFAKHTETQEDMVIYQALYGDYTVWTRPRDMFYGTVEVDGKMVPRFRCIADFPDETGVEGATECDDVVGS